MTDRPIIFSAPMVRALLDGRKTQTRRVLKQYPYDRRLRPGMVGYKPTPLDLWQIGDDGPFIRVPYAPGHRLWVREAFIGARGYDDDPPSRWGNKPIWYAADGEPDRDRWWQLSDRKRSPIHMPRWASRLTLIVTDVRVQRVQEISEADAVAEGIERCAWAEEMAGDGRIEWHVSGKTNPHPTARGAFWDLWNSLHGTGAWDRNPWVAAITFTVQHGNIDGGRTDG